MASTSTINSWLDELASSIVVSGATNARQNKRRAVDGFRRRVRYHTYARTNQFDVEDRFNGVEERFQIQNRDDLSDILREQRLELRTEEYRWLPDMFDLLLRLSNDPIRKTKITDLRGVESQPTLPPPLTWAEVEKDDPFDRSDPIWKLPVLSDLSSDEDEIEVSTGTTSPTEEHRPDLSVEQRATSDSVVKVFDQAIAITELHDTISRLPMTIRGTYGVVSEIQMVRESLHMLQGYPTTIFTETKNGVVLEPGITLQHAGHDVLDQVVNRLVTVREQISTLRAWTDINCSDEYVQVIKQESSQVVASYISWLSQYTIKLLRPSTLTTVSLLQTVDLAEKEAQKVGIFADYVKKLETADSISCLDLLYNAANEHFLCGIQHEASELLIVFVKAFAAYAKPIQIWLAEGRLDSRSQFFVRAEDIKSNMDSLWHDWFVVRSGGATRPPAFLTAFADDILAIGKTSAFLHYTLNNTSSSSFVPSGFNDFLKGVYAIASDPIMPFSAAFQTMLNDYLSTLLSSKTTALKKALDNECDLTQTLEAFDYIYLGKDGVILDDIESRIFNRIDRCIESWNDRFLIADTLDEGFATVSCIDVSSLTVHSARTSFRSMESRRKSVKILSALAIEYNLPWPIANLISKDSMASYRRLALQLFQIRRAKYSLERAAYLHLQQHPISNNVKDQKSAQGILFTFIQFTNTIYDHFTTAVISPSTQKMHTDLHTALKLDDMISVHRSYINKLEFACLTAKNLKILSDTLIGLLDMCIRFSDLTSTTSSQHTTDHEANSFTSARSHQRRKSTRPRRVDSDDFYSSSSSEDDDNLEGYSSFIVLDENTTIIDEMRKLQGQFRRQLDFFVAGLRGVGRGGETVEEFEVLAGRLEWRRVVE